MIGFADYNKHATDLLSVDRPTQIALRRAVSSLYYGLFHHLTWIASAVFSGGGLALQHQVTRAFSHTGMLKVCKAYSSGKAQPLPGIADGVVPLPIDHRIVSISKTFIQLQAARHVADYDLSTTLAETEVLLHWAKATQAHTDLMAIAPDAGTIVFMAALLLEDRWKKIG